MTVSRAVGRVRFGLAARVPERGARGRVRRRVHRGGGSGPGRRKGAARSRRPSSHRPETWRARSPRSRAAEATSRRLRRVGFPRHGIRPAGPHHRRPELLRQGRRRAAPLPRGQAGRQPRRADRSGRARSRTSRLRSRHSTWRTSRWPSTPTAPPRWRSWWTRSSSWAATRTRRRHSQRFVDVKPGVPAFTRVSYNYELHGNLAGARFAMQRALATAYSSDDRAFALFELGELAWNNGELARAHALYRKGWAADHDYVGEPLRAREGGRRARRRATRRPALPAGRRPPADNRRTSSSTPTCSPPWAVPLRPPSSTR